jgi:hypothetical protein
MLRYYAIATAIVLAVAVLATMGARDIMRLHFRSSNAPQPQQHLRYGDSAGENQASLAGDAPWALSALPDCFIQQAEWTGTATYVDAHLPHGARAIEPGTQLRYGPCTISVRSGEVFVNRGADRFRIPPHAVLYQDGAQLWLLRAAGHSSVLRSYTITATP